MAQNKKLYVSFLWHMHQPYYKNLSSGEYIMPWVRLHGTKDYLDMLLVLKDYPNVKMNFNLVPSLVEQIIDYAENGAEDTLLKLTRKNPEELLTHEKLVIIKKFFMAHTENMIKIYPRYKELFERRGWAKTPEELERTLRYFSNDDLRDIQVWFTLAWIDPILRKEDPFLRGLYEKGHYFTEEEKLTLIDKQRDILRRIIPAYKDAQERGQIEISTTPFYHPILPLLCNTDFARRAHPQSLLPRQPFRHPEDANEHIRRSVEYFTGLFGKSPKGIWPSEGSVCPELIPMFDDNGFNWFATDEEILSLSMASRVFKRNINGVLSEKAAKMLYQPYIVEHEGKKCAAVFRDHYLSDLIGFQYANWKSEDAAEDMIERLENIAKLTEFENADGEPPLVSIILDGENCWEHYYIDGLYFLRALYEKLNNHPFIESITIGEYIEKHPPKTVINNLFTGSWIFHDFGIWIGHKEDIQAWEYLNETRAKVMEKIEQNKGALTPEKIKQAKDCLMIAEGSDWCWWYGDDHSSGSDDEFDALYREHLMNACRAVDVEIPSKLYVPISSKGETGRVIQPKNYIEPEIDGRDTNYYEWFLAGCYDPVQGGDSMHQVTHYLKKLYFGYNRNTLFIRLDPDRDLLTPRRDDEIEFAIIFYLPNAMEFSLTHPAKDNKHFLNIIKSTEEYGKTKFGEISSVGVGYIVEIAIPFNILGIKENTNIHFQVVLRSNGKEIEKCPSRAPVSVYIPEDDFYSQQWLV